MKKIYTSLLILLSVGIGSLIIVTTLPVEVFAQSCGGAETSLIKCSGNGVWYILSTTINILTAGVFIAALGGIVYASIMYTTAGANQEQVKKARTIITNVVLGMVVFAMMFAVLQWLIPGGLFNSSGDIEGLPETETQSGPHGTTPAGGGIR